jgi:hypothetical protein
MFLRVIPISPFYFYFRLGNRIPFLFQLVFYVYCSNSIALSGRITRKGMKVECH